MPKRKLEIEVSLGSKRLRLLETLNDESRALLEVDVVSGCDASGTPAGKYRAGKWIKDKTNPVHGKVPWSADSWANPYGPYFLQLLNAKTGSYTTYGIHGTRGPVFGNFVRPPVPEFMLKPFLGEDAKWMYCSHGCIRVSNQNILTLFGLMTKLDRSPHDVVPVNVEK